MAKPGPFGIVPAVEPAGKEKPGDQANQEKLNDSTKSGDNLKIKFSDKINFFSWSKKNEEENQDKLERALRERLVRFAQVPASTIFDLEPSSSPSGLSTEAARSAFERHGPNITISPPLSRDNVDPEYLTGPKIWNAKSIARFMIFMGPTSSVFDMCVFIINWYKYKIRTLDSPLVPLAQTNWFTEGALTQIFIIHFLRTGKIPFFQSRASTPVVILTSIIACIVIAIPYVPKLNTAIDMTPLRPEYYGFLAAMIFAYAILVQTMKTIYQHLFREWL